MTGPIRIPKPVLAKLRKRLPRGFRKEAVKRMNAKGKAISEDSLSQVLAGKFNNDLALSVLMQIAEEHEHRVKQISRRAIGARTRKNATTSR